MSFGSIFFIFALHPRVFFFWFAPATKGVFGYMTSAAPTNNRIMNLSWQFIRPMGNKFIYGRLAALNKLFSVVLQCVTYSGFFFFTF